MAKEQGKIRRFGGRWIREGQQYKERHRFVRTVLGRFWYLLVPFIGIMCANDTYVRPDLEDIKNIKNLERKDVLDRKDDLRVAESAEDTEIVTAETIIDSLHAQITLYKSVKDSLVDVRRIYDLTLPETESRADSLHAIHDEIEAEVEQLSETFRHKSASLDSLQGWQETLIDSITGLDDDVGLRADQLYRLRHPKEFRRKDALFTGDGEYPRRDENPSRQKGN